MKNVCCEMVKCSVLLTFVLRHKTFSKVSHLRLASEDYLALSSYFVFLTLVSRHFTSILVMSCLATDWLMKPIDSSLPFWNMSGTTRRRLDFSQCFSILPSLKIYKKLYLFVFEEVLSLFFNPRLPCDFHYLEVNYNFYYIFKRYCSSYSKTCFMY